MDATDNEPYLLVRDKAYSYLTRREYSRSELYQKLIRLKEIDAGVVEQVLDDLVSAGAQSDLRFAEHLCRVRINQGKGPVLIEHELNQHKIDSESIEQVMSEHSDEWRRLALDVRQKKFGPEPPADFKEWAKQARFLQQRGFGNAEIGSFNDID